jgi:hypothetical protein
MSGTRYPEFTLDQYIRMVARWPPPSARYRRTGCPSDLRDPAHGQQRVAVIAPRDRGNVLDLPSLPKRENLGEES